MIKLDHVSAYIFDIVDTGDLGWERGLDLRGYVRNHIIEEVFEALGSGEDLYLCDHVVIIRRFTRALI
jgi:hypothetical protein